MTLIKSGTINVAITATMMLLDTTLSSIISLWTILSLFVGLMFLCIIGLTFYKFLYNMNRDNFMFKKIPREHVLNSFIRKENGLPKRMKMKFVIPFVEGYIEVFPRFIVVEVTIAILLALCDLFGFLGCIIKSIAMILVLLVYLLITSYYRPFQEVLLRVALPLIAFIQIIVIIVTLPMFNKMTLIILN